MIALKHSLLNVVGAARDTFPECVGLGHDLVLFFCNGLKIA